MSKTSTFLQSQINKELERLREKCAVQRCILDHQLRCHPDNWGGNPEQSRKSRDEELPKTRARIVAADKALAVFVREHRHLMPADWIGNDHGRLCWDRFVSHCPIQQHYCQLPEGHSGPHQDAVGCWPNKAEEFAGKVQY